MLSSFYPVIAGRVSDASNRNRSLYQIQTGRQELERLQNQLSSGLRFTSPSEDPAAAIRVIGIQRELEFQEQSIKNLNSASTFLSASESNISNAQDILNDIRSLGLEASGNVVSDSDRTQWLQQIDTAISRLQAIANTQYQDRYLFSGGVVTNPAVSTTSKGIEFTGNNLDLLSLANYGDPLVHNVTGQQALGLQSTSVTSRTALSPIAQPETRLSELRNGQGITPGAIQFSNGDERVSIDLAKASTLEEVLNSVNGKVSLNGREIQMSLVNGSLSVQYADGLPGVLRVQNVATGRTATDLGIATNTPAPTLPITGNDLKPVTRLTTSLSSLNQGAGFAWDEGFTIRQGDQAFQLDFTGAETVEDILRTIERSGASVSATLSADGKNLQIQSRLSGVDFSIEESSGTLAGDLGLRTLHPQTKLADLAHGQGLTLVDGADFLIMRNDGTELGIDLNGAINLQDVLDRINNHPDNQTAGTRVVASLLETGNGITLTSPTPAVPTVPDPGPLRVRSVNGSQAAWGLGLVNKGESESTAQTVGGEYVLQGRDPNPQEVKGVFNSLLRFREAILNGDMEGIARAVNLVDGDLDRMNLSRGSIGVDMQRVDNLKNFKEENNATLSADKSQLMEADMYSVISELTARQTAYEASLRMLASVNQLTLFNYI